MSRLCLHIHGRKIDQKGTSIRHPGIEHTSTDVHQILFHGRPLDIHKKQSICICLRRESFVQLKLYLVWYFLFAKVTAFLLLCLVYYV